MVGSSRTGRQRRIGCQTTVEHPSANERLAEAGDGNFGVNSNRWPPLVIWIETHADRASRPRTCVELA